MQSVFLALDLEGQHLRGNSKVAVERFWREVFNDDVVNGGAFSLRIQRLYDMTTTCKIDWANKEVLIRWLKDNCPHYSCTPETPSGEQPKQLCDG